VPYLPVAMVIHNRADRAVNGQLLPVNAEARKLRVEVGKVPSLKERIVGKANYRGQCVRCRKRIARFK